MRKVLCLFIFCGLSFAENPLLTVPEDTPNSNILNLLFRDIYKKLGKHGEIIVEVGKSTKTIAAATMDKIFWARNVRAESIYTFKDDDVQGYLRGLDLGKLSRGINDEAQVYMTLVKPLWVYATHINLTEDTTTTIKIDGEADFFDAVDEDSISGGSEYSFTDEFVFTSNTSYYIPGSYTHWVVVNDVIEGNPVRIAVASVDGELKIYQTTQASQNQYNYALTRNTNTINTANDIFEVSCQAKIIDLFSLLQPRLRLGTNHYYFESGWDGAALYSKISYELPAGGWSSITLETLQEGDAISVYFSHISSSVYYHIEYRGYDYAGVFETGIRSSMKGLISMGTQIAIGTGQHFEIRVPYYKEIVTRDYTVTASTTFALTKIFSTPNEDVNKRGLGFQYGENAFFLFSAAGGFASYSNSFGLSGNYGARAGRFEIYNSSSAGIILHTDLLSEPISIIYTHDDGQVEISTTTNIKGDVYAYNAIIRDTVTVPAVDFGSATVTSDAFGLRVSSNLFVAGVVTATFHYGSGKYLTDLPQVSTATYAESSAGEYTVKISSNDTTGGYLGAKIIAGANVVISTENPSGNEYLKIGMETGGGGLSFYGTAQAADIAGYYLMLSTFGSVNTSTITYSSIASGTVFIASFTTLSGYPSVTSLDGVMDMHIHVNKSGNKVIRIFAKIYKYSLGGVSTLLAISDTTPELVSGDSVINFVGVIVAEKMLVTDRVTGTIYAIVTGAPATDLSLYFEGGTNSHLSLPVSGVVRHPDLTNLDYASAGHIGFASDAYEGFVSTTGDTMSGNLIVPEINVSSINARDSKGLYLLDDGNNGIFIEDGGKVGIGTSSPADKFHIVDTRTDNENAALFIQQTGVNPNGTIYGAVVEKTGASRTNVGGSFSATGATANNYGLLVSNGDVGIGTTSPIVKLDVNGVIRSTENIVNGNSYVTGFSSANAYYGDISNCTGAGTGDAVLASTQTFTGQNTFADIVNISSKTKITVTSGGALEAGDSNCSATGNYAIAIGFNTTASGVGSTAMGKGTTASAEGATTMGINAIANGYTSTAMGLDTTASGEVATTMGMRTTASGDYSFAAGRKSSATAQGSFAISDSEDTQFLVNVQDQFGARFAGGYKLTGGSVTISSHTKIGGDLKAYKVITTTIQAQDANGFYLTNQDGATMVYISTKGVVTKPFNPCAKAYLSADQSNLDQNTWIRVTFNTESYDVGSNFDLVNSRFVAPITGYYQVNACVVWEWGDMTIDTAYRAAIYINDIPRAQHITHASLEELLCNSISNVMYVEAEQRVEIYVYHSAGDNLQDIAGGDINTFMSVALLQ